MKRAYLFVYVWPEPFSSAAGVRTLQMAQHLSQLGIAVTLVSPCKENSASQFWRDLGFSTLCCPSNDRQCLSNLALQAPHLVIFDRFVMEEQFGWQIRELWPQAIQIVDTQDLHHVRRFREQLAKEGLPISSIQSMQGWVPNEDFDRELSSLYRADCCLVVSSWEKNWLIQHQFPKDRVFCIPFSPQQEAPASVSFEGRDSFLFVGNFRHPPNLDGARWLVSLWKTIYEETKKKLVLAGAYPSQEVSQWNRANFIEVKSSVQTLAPLFQKSIALLAPLRYGAGIKGKILEAWSFGVPVVSTSIGLEGMADSLSFDTEQSWKDECLRLHQDHSYWVQRSNESLSNGTAFSKASLKNLWNDCLVSSETHFQSWRKHPVTRMLKFHQNNSYKYFSLWIEEKNRERK